MDLNHEVAAVFHQLADLMDIKGENTFKVLAFRKVGRILENLGIDLRRAVEEDRVGEIEGVGAHSKRIIEEYVRTGQSTDYEELRASVPAGLLPLLNIEGVGPKTLALLWKLRNITSAEELSVAIAQNKLEGIKGIGPKKIEIIRRGLEARAKAAGRVGIAEAMQVAQPLLQQIQALPGVKRAELAGSLRRGRETIGDIDLLAVVQKPAAATQVVQAFTQLPGVDRVLAAGDVKASIVSESGVQVDLRILPPEHWGAGLLYFTGSKDHNVRIRGLAQKMGLTLNEWGLYRLEDYDKADKQAGQAPAAKPLAAATEQEIYQRLGMQYIPSELREDRGEVEAALEKRLPRLLTQEDLRGDLHTHTTASDGTATIEQMALAARDLGYEFLAITDHSKSQVIANGLDERRLIKHAADVRKANVKGITLLAGAEVDILGDGRLDYEDAVLKELDFVVASPHFALKLDSAKATARLLRAIEHKYVNVIGHPTGRLIGRREGLPLDFAQVLKAAADSGTALEINAGYPRLDLSEVHARAAIDAGVMLSVNTDAHSTAGLGDMALGLVVARRAWVTPESVINCMKLGDLRRFIQKKR